MNIASKVTQLEKLTDELVNAKHHKTQVWAFHNGKATCLYSYPDITNQKLTIRIGEDIVAGWKRAIDPRNSKSSGHQNGYHYDIDRVLKELGISKFTP